MTIPRKRLRLINIFQMEKIFPIKHNSYNILFDLYLQQFIYLKVDRMRLKHFKIKSFIICVLSTGIRVQ